MILKNLIYIYQLEHYDKKRFLKFAYKNINWIHINKRNSLDWTIRTKLIFGITATSIIMLIFLSYIYLENIAYFTVFVLFYIITLPLFIIISDLSISPLVEYKKTQSINLAKTIISKNKKKGLITIGITGSYGKTSMKNILVSVLNKKYKVFTFSGNINTDIGVAQYIIDNEKSIKKSDILVSEMGAFQLGDIKNLCNIINPDYSITTSIGEVHLERFKSLKNIIQTKFELANNTNKIVFLNTCDDTIKNNADSKINKNIEIIKVCDNYSEKKYLDNFNGLSFNYNSQIFTTNLIADYIINYFIIVIKLSKKLNLTNKEISKGFNDLSFIPHRLEVIKNNELNRIIIDDSYNGNYSGFCEGINILKRAKGRKIVLTPGIVELGEKLIETHKNLAKKYAKNIDLVLLIKTKATSVIVEKFKELRYNNYKVYNTTKEAHDDLSNVLKNGDTIIFQNDITDNYK